MWLHVPPSFQFAPGSECSISDSDLPSMLARSATWSGKSRPCKSWRTAWRTGCLTPLRFGPTSQRLTLEDSGALTFSPAESRANLSVSPASYEATTIHAPSRLTCCGSSASACLPWCSSKMFLPGFFSVTHEDSSADFRIWAIASRSRSFAELRTLALRTVESGCLSWPTAKVATGAYSYSRGDRTKRVDNLIGAAEKWPSPRTSDTNGAGQHGTGGMDLRTKVDMWATPNLPSGGRTLSDEETKSKGKTSKGKRQVDLANQARVFHPAQAATGPTSTPDCGRPRLNPLFVEWLMGLPIGYTDCEPLGTESFRSWWRMHFELLWGGSHR